MSSRLKSLAPAVAAVLAMAVASSCGGNSDGDSAGAGGADNVSVPRPYAYPRTPQLPDSFVTLAAGPLNMQVNAAARIDTVDDGQYTLTYPAINATLFLTVNHDVGDLDAAVANRSQRISLNLGGAPALRHDLVNDATGDSAMVITARTPVQIPVQLLSVNPRRRTLVFGAVVMDGWTNATPYDSVNTVIAQLTDQATHLVNTIAHDNP